MDSTWLLRLPVTGTGLRLAVKDCIDIAGTVTTVGSRAVAADAVPARYDAAVVASARAQGARIVGKTNLVELCRHADGHNAWTGTPRNPLDPDRVPGGSSSGSAVAVATGEADVAYGTDTGGSVRVPAACCGIAALKTTAGRIPTHGVFEYSRTMDTVGALARDVAGLAAALALMEPGFTVATLDRSRPLTAARLRVDDVDPAIDAAIDAALDGAGVRTTDVQMPDWRLWRTASDDLMTAEGWLVHSHFLERRDLLEPRHAEDIAAGAGVSAQRVVDCRRTAAQARRVLGSLLNQYDVLALSTLDIEPPRLTEPARLTYLTVPFNLAGLPAVSLPLPRAGAAPIASLQLASRWNDEESLSARAAIIEHALLHHS